MDINVMLTNLPCGVRGFTKITAEPEGDFATTVLNKWLDEKRNLSSRLPYLQTYMGHKDMAATAYYIHLLPEQLVKNAGVDWDSMKAIVPRCELWEK